MGGNKRRLSPKTRQFNERLLTVQFAKWGNGLVEDSFETPSNGFAKLHNARDHQEEIRGNRGSFLWTLADFGVIIPDGTTETLTEAIESGVIYEANNNTIPSVDDVFIVYNGLDFADNGLMNAKDAQQSIKARSILPYDMFKIVADGIEYIGNLSYPVFDDWVTHRNGYSYSSFADFEVLMSDLDAENGIYGITFGVTTSLYIQSGEFGNFYELKGNYLNILYAPDKIEKIYKRFYITDTQINGSNYSLTVKGESNFVTGIGIVPYLAFIQAPIYASFWHSLKNTAYIHTGKKLYKSDLMLSGWEEIPGIYEHPLIEAESEISNNNENGFLINYAGVYKINDFEEILYYFKLNDKKPKDITIAEPINLIGLYKPEYEQTDGNIINNDFNGNSNNPIRACGFGGSSASRQGGKGLGIGRDNPKGILL